MLDIDSYTIDIQCPRCRFHNSVTIKQVRLEDVVICRGCKANIQYRDHMRSTHKAVQDLRRQLRQLEQRMAQPIKISIKL